MAGPIRPINPTGINPLVPSDELTQEAEKFGAEEQAAAGAQRLTPPKRFTKFSADPQTIFFEEDKFTPEDAVVPVSRKGESPAPDDSSILYEERVEAGEQMGAFYVLARELSDEKLRPNPNTETDYKIALGKKSADSSVRLPEQPEIPTPEQIASYKTMVSHYKDIPEFNELVTSESAETYYAPHNPRALEAFREVRNPLTEPANKVYLAGVAEALQTGGLPSLDYNVGAQPVRDAVGALSFYTSLFTLAA